MRLFKQLAVLVLFLTLFACDAQEGEAAKLDDSNKSALTKENSSESSNDNIASTEDETASTEDKAESAENDGDDESEDDDEEDDERHEYRGDEDDDDYDAEAALKWQEVDENEDYVKLVVEDYESDFDKKEDSRSSDSTSDVADKYKGKKFEVIDSSEVIIDGSSTLVVTFSIPVDPKADFSNLVKLVDRKSGFVDGTWELSDNGLELKHRYLEPRRELRLRVSSGLKAANGRYLESVYNENIDTRDRPPMIGFASSGAILPSKSMSGLPIKTLNVDKVDINFFKIKQESLSRVVDDLSSVNILSVWQSQKLQKHLDLVYSSRFDLNPKANVEETIIVDLSKVSELNQEGVYIAVMNEAGTYNYSNTVTLFSVSNIGVSLHDYKNGKLVVMAHGLDDGKPLANVNISLNCRVYSGRNSGSKNKRCKTLSAKTDKDGYAVFTKKKKAEYSLLTASNGTQTSFMHINRNALNLTEFNLSGGQFYSKQLFVFGPRDLYRPNETVYFNALLRDADGQPLRDQPIIADVMSADGNVVKHYQLKSRPNSNGLYQQQFMIPADAATGKWSIRFNLGDDNYRYWNFNVEEFLPERMALEIENPWSGKPVTKDEGASFFIKAKYLYGAPAAGNRYDTNIYIKRENSIEGLSGFLIGSITGSNPERELSHNESKLDSQGLAPVYVEKDNWSRLSSPIKVVMQASVFESGGRPVTRYATQSIWPASKLPAIRPLIKESSYYDWNTDRYGKRPTVDVDSNAEFEVAYVDIDGKKLATDSLKARLVRERRDYYWVWSDNDGWRVKYKASEFVVSEDSLSIDEGGIAKIVYQPTDYGSYRVEIVDTDTKVVTSYRFWSGFDWEDNTNGTKSVRPDQVKLTIDKPSYRAGDVAKVNVQAPTAGSGYISLETNDGPIWKKAITVGEKGLDVDVPIENWGRHDVYISAMIVRPSTDASVQTVKRAIGLLHLPIDTSDRQLNLSIQTPNKVLPESVVPVRVKVDKSLIQKDKNVTVLVSAVDSGVLNITNYVTPDPYTEFLGRKRYDVDIYDVYGKLIEASGRNVNMSFGGDAMIEGGKKPLNDPQIVAQQLKTIQLNDQGEGVINLPLPNFNGELRIMAQAWDANRFGKAERRMIVVAPVVAELSTPRFMAGGDRSLLTLDLHNLTDFTQDIQVEVSTAGLVNQAEPKKLSIKLDSKQKEIIQFPVVADYGYGQGTISVDIKGIFLTDDEPNLDIHRSWTIGVRPAYAVTTKSYSFAVAEGENWQLSTQGLSDQVLSKLIDNTVEGKLVISNRPPLNIAQYIKELYAYPYGCLEQTTSGLFPSLYANSEQLAKLGIKTDSNEERRKKVQRGIERILSMQRTNGSFGLWNNESREEFWLTVYATDFLLQAKERGYDVNEKALNAAMSRLSQYIYDPSAFDYIYSYNYYHPQSVDFSKLSVKTYALMVLNRQNRYTIELNSEMLNLADDIVNKRIELYSPLPIAQLAVAAKRSGYDDTYDSLLPLIFSTPYKYEYWFANYGSEVRDRSLILSLLIENDIAKNKQGDYLLKLSDLLSNKSYLSTQDLNSLFIAGWSLEQHSIDNKFKVNVNGEVSEVNSSFTRTFNYKQLKQGVSINNTESKAPLYAKLSISGYGKKPPAKTSSDSFFHISRTYYDLKGNEISPENLEVGSMMAVVLDVTSDEQVNDALVVDFLPAGLEIENQNLANSNINLSKIPAISDFIYSEDSTDIKHQEYRDDRYVAAMSINSYDNSGYRTRRKRTYYFVRAVTVGDYMVPAPYVESMYKPERFAIGYTPKLISITDPKSKQEKEQEQEEGQKQEQEK
jgi:alpha-2-macroglobulin